MKKIFNKILSSHVLRKDKDTNLYVYSKDIEENATDVVIDLDIVLNSVLTSKYLVSVVDSMSVNKGILDLIGFFRKNNSCNTHIFSSGKKENTFILDKVLSSGFCINSIYSYTSNKLNSKYLDLVKLLNLIELLCSFSDLKKHKVVFILSSIEELYFINIIQNYINNLIDEKEFKANFIYKTFSDFIDFSKVKNIDLEIQAIFLLKPDTTQYKIKGTVDSILNSYSKVCIFDNYLDISLGLFVSNIMDKKSFISFLEYAHNHLGEDIDNILSKISYLKSNNLDIDSDTNIFKINSDVESKNKKYYPISNYMIKENKDFGISLQKISSEFFSK